MRRESLKYSTRQDKTIEAKQGRSRGGEGEKNATAFEESQEEELYLLIYLFIYI